MNSQKKHHSAGIGRILLGALTLAVLTVFAAPPQNAMSATAVGTTINNTVTVTWTGGSNSASATVDVIIKESAPTLAFVSSVPASLVSVAEGAGITLNYTLTSTSNGDDSYDLSAPFTDNSAVITTPTETVNGGTTTVSLGASMALADVAVASTDIIIPGLAVDHGLASGETVIIGGTSYTINSVSDDGTDTTLTLDTAITITAGTPIYERLEFAVTFTSGTLQGANTTGDHDITTAAEVTGNAALNDQDARTVTVTKAALDITKTADTATAQPGETITYKVVVTNNGAADASSVVITDPLPAFTTYEAGSAESSANAAANYGDAGNTALDDDTAGAPDDGYDFGITTADEATYTVGTLAQGSSIVLFFQVTIDN
ncbi:MAG: hypothetical protein R6W72_01905 [Desulfurivibrionaceae bacterium]